MIFQQQSKVRALQVSGNTLIIFDWNISQLAAENPKSNVKELMFACGFTSRATFYRNFSEKYGVSPSKFIENQRVEQ